MPCCKRSPVLAHSSPPSVSPRSVTLAASPRPSKWCPMPVSSHPSIPPAARSVVATLRALARRSFAGQLSRRQPGSLPASRPLAYGMSGCARRGAPASHASPPPPTFSGSCTASGGPDVHVEPARQHPFPPWSPSACALSTVRVIGSRAGLHLVPKRTDRWMAKQPHPLDSREGGTQARIVRHPIDHKASFIDGRVGRGTSGTQNSTANGCGILWGARIWRMHGFGTIEQASGHELFRAHRFASQVEPDWLGLTTRPINRARSPHRRPRCNALLRCGVGIYAAFTFRSPVVNQR